MQPQASEVLLFTDGACSGNPGAGGWACLLFYKDQGRRLSGFEPHTTNNRMELTAVIKGLSCLSRPTKVVITTDSQYVKNAFTEGWLTMWKKKGWRATGGGAVKNQDLWMQLDALVALHEVRWEWVRGHGGHPENEECDRLARAAIQNQKGIDERFVKPLAKL